MNLFEYFSNNSKGMLVFAALVAALILFIQWLSWIFNLGRYSRPRDTDNATRQSIRFLIAEALAKVINDFRHLLALIIVAIFGFALIYVMFKAGSSYDNLLAGVQAVAAALGGLIGSIIGYYFGESAAKPLMQSPVGGNTGVDEIEQGNSTPNGGPNGEDIRPAPNPPPARPGDSSERNDHDGI